MSEISVVLPQPPEPEHPSSPPSSQPVLASTPAPPLPLSRRIGAAAIVGSSFIAWSASTLFQFFEDLLAIAAGATPGTVAAVAGGLVLGGAFAGAFITTVVRHAKLLNLFVAAVWFVSVTLGGCALLSALKPGAISWSGAIVSVALIAPAMIIGGLVDYWFERRARARGRRKVWTYRCADGSEIEVLSPWRFPGLSAAWFAAAILFFATCWVPLVEDLTERLSANAEGRDSPTGGPSIFEWVVVGLACYGMSRKRWAASVDEVLAKDPRPPVVYLRSFGDDGRAMEEGFWFELSNGLRALINKTIEQRLAKHLGAVGPFVAIGRPGEELPELGAARVYVPDADWQKMILDTLTRGELAVLQCGMSPGLRWELSTVTTNLRPDQVLLFIPHRVNRKPQRREEFYRGFRNWAAPHVPGELPEKIDDAFFLYFSADPAWKVCMLRPGEAVPASHPRHVLLNRLARDKVFRRPPTFSLFTKILIVGLGLLVLFPALMMLTIQPVIGLVLLTFALVLLSLPFFV